MLIFKERMIIISKRDSNQFQQPHFTLFWATLFLYSTLQIWKVFKYRMALVEKIKRNISTLLLPVKWLKITRIARKEIVKIAYNSRSTDITVFMHLYHILIRNNLISVLSTIKALFTQCTLSLPPENRKPYSFLMFSEGRERVHWEQMG